MEYASIFVFLQGKRSNKSNFINVQITGVAIVKMLIYNKFKSDGCLLYIYHIDD
jgi:hypothetical protein